MKFAIIDTYYPSFLKSFHCTFPELKHKSYKYHLQTLLKSCFGTSDYYSYNLKGLGREAINIIANDELLQKQWAKENELIFPKYDFRKIFHNLPYIYRLLGRPKWMQEIVLEQVETEKPDVCFLQNLTAFDPQYLKKVKSYTKLLVGQIASPLPSISYIKQFDLILTSLPHFIKKIRNLGVKSEYFKIGFEKRILTKIRKQNRKYPVVFIGSFSPYHMKGTALLERVTRFIPIHIWGTGMEFVTLFSPLRKNYHGEAWGLDMYSILASSKIVINRHIDIAGEYANNMRMFEATGMGALLITDKKKNNNNLFTVEKEIVEYENADDLVMKIKYYLSHTKERELIAKRGQYRTLHDHSYKIRMKELIHIVNKFL